MHLPWRTVTLSLWGSLPTKSGFNFQEFKQYSVLKHPKY